MKFLNQNGPQFRIHYVSGPTDTVGSRVHIMAQSWGPDMSLQWQQPPRPL